ncbi:H-NS histone family protein (plasmid) [Dyella sp. BiH032]|uniref:H-NS histone family protein n=1 Tax=Dyella sp. BiH032 TaxID=3075430 RepID=UPI002892AB44|nr:H-NS histone family protein [Dyella sp. BiH032]WNL48438.1 H-NS histone family protein [Dyella sp. BiH032]
MELQVNGRTNQECAAQNAGAQISDADLTGCTEGELEAVVREARSRKRQVLAERRSKLRQEIFLMIRQQGLSAEEVLPEIVHTGRRPPKYRHPTLPLLTWSGAGEPPPWYLDFLSYGNSKERLLVEQPRAPEVATGKIRTVAKPESRRTLFPNVRHLARKLATVATD